MSNNSEFQLEFTLFSDVSAHKVSVFATKVEIYLEKKTRGLKWLSLEHKELTSAPVSYPSSSKNPKNWDSIEKDIKKEESQTVPKGDEAVNELFRKIYANAPEETRRAMNKSFVTIITDLLARIRRNLSEHKLGRSKKRNCENITTRRSRSKEI